MKIDIGCSDKKKDGYIGIDIVDYTDKYPTGQFIQANLFIEFPFDDNSIEKVYASHFIEHVPQDKVIWFFNEIYRILIPDGIFEIYFPPTQSPDGKVCRGAFCDPMHRSYWNDMSFQYFDGTFPELSKGYGIKCNFKVLENRFLSEWNHHVILKALK